MKKTALYENHKKRGGKIVEFGGFQLPVWFSSLKEEHTAVRNQCGAFDISHMGVLKLQGPGSYDFLSYITCNNVAKTQDEKVIYSMLLNEEGNVLDDMMFGKLGEDYMVIVNASNKNKILAWFANYLPKFDTKLTDMTETHGFIAIQGPTAAQKLTDLLGIDFTTPKRFAALNLKIKGIDCIAMRSGYTGEDGYEIVVPNESIEIIWDAIIDGGVTPCGLGARDTLRLEFGLPLYGQELSDSINPWMTRYKWVVNLEHDFIGKEALLKLKDQPQPLTTVGLEMKDKAIPRTHYKIKEGGEITSGTLSPSLDKPIALAMVKPENAEIGSTLHVEIRGKDYEATVVKVPFIQK